MKDKDTTMLEEAINEVYGSRGEYQIHVQLVDASGNVIDKMAHPVAGDEAAWGSYKEIHNFLQSNE